MSPLHPRLHRAALLLFPAITTIHAEDATGCVWQIAQPRKVVPGTPRASDVTVRNLRPHPVPGKKDDVWGTLAMIRDFHVTRLEWTYGLDAAFVRKLKALGLTVGGAIEDDPGSRTKLGRVIGKDGQFATHRWFAKDRLVGCANAPEFRAAWLAEAQRNVDAGVDLMQQDDPQMAARTTPKFCYCKYCQAAFAQYQKQHGSDADYEQFQRDSILAFHREMHRRLDAYAGRHIPFSHNSIVHFRGEVDWTAPAFDFINAPAARPAKFLSAVAKCDVPMVLTYRDTSVENNRRLLALSYATGTWMMMPWDVFLPNNAPRYFGTAEEYADLSGFGRANAQYLDGYAAAAQAGPDVAETRYGATPPVAIEGGSGDPCARFPCSLAAPRPIFGHRAGPVVTLFHGFGAARLSGVRSSTGGVPHTARAGNPRSVDSV